MPARSRSQRCSWILAFAGMTMKGTAAGRSAGFDKLMPERFNPIRTDSRSALYARPVPGLEIGSRDFGDGLADDTGAFHGRGVRSEEHTSELQSLMRISYAVFCLKQKTKNNR